MKIVVVDQAGEREEIPGGLNELWAYLTTCASAEYGITVLNWFIDGVEKRDWISFRINNGPDEGQEVDTWFVETGTEADVFDLEDLEAEFDDGTMPASVGQLN